MTPEEFKEKMQEIKAERHDDPEVSHIAMDDEMCDLLRELGYGEGVDIIESTTRWYA